MIQTNSRTGALYRKYQYEALLTLRLNCRLQGDLETSRTECKVKKRLRVKSVALAVKNHYMTTSMAWCPVSNMVIIKSKVISGLAWRPASHGVSPKKIF